MVDALVTAVRDSFPRLSHRYYAMKAKWLGLEKLQHWDRNAPLPERRRPRHRLAEAREDRARQPTPPSARNWPTIGGSSSTGPGSTRALRPGKAGGAFAHPTVPSAHPYLLLNYHGKTRDVMTLAHELGHGVHQVLAARAGLPAVRHAADPGRDRQRVRRDADLPRPARCRDATRRAAGPCWPARSRTC